MRSVFYCSLTLYVTMAMMVMSERKNCFFEALQELSNLQMMVGKECDIRLYCPNLNGIKDCWKETLECFKAELNVLDFEFDGDSKWEVTQLISNLKERFDVHLSYLSFQLIWIATLMGICTAYSPSGSCGTSL
ncbi:uncharacterized protein LOC144671506 isoform X2 [Cetorhinus maximus]